MINAENEKDHSFPALANVTSVDLNGLKDQEGRKSHESILIAALLCGAIVLFGLSWPVVKIALSSTGTPPLLLVCSRSGFAFLTLLAVAILRRQFSVPARADIPALFGIGVLQLTGFFLLCHIAIKSVPASHTAILSNAAIIWVVPLSAIMGRLEHRGKWFAALLSLGGILVILRPWAIDVFNTQSAFGYGILLAAALAWAGTIVVLRNFPAKMAAPDLLLWSFGLSFALLLAFCVALKVSLVLPAGSMGYALFNGALVAPAGTYFLITLAKKLSPTVTAIALLAIPICGVLVSCIILGEEIGASLIIGSLLIFAGIVVASRF